MHDKFFQKARLNMVKNQILPNNVTNKELIDAFYNVKKENGVGPPCGGRPFLALID